MLNSAAVAFNLLLISDISDQAKDETLYLLCFLRTLEHSNVLLQNN